MYPSSFFNIFYSFKSSKFNGTINLTGTGKCSFYNNSDSVNTTPYMCTKSLGLKMIDDKNKIPMSF